MKIKNEKQRGLGLVFDSERNFEIDVIMSDNKKSLIDLLQG